MDEDTEHLTNNDIQKDSHVLTTVLVSSFASRLLLMLNRIRMGHCKPVRFLSTLILITNAMQRE